jgi:hypothetical protein
VNALRSLFAECFRDDFGFNTHYFLFAPLVTALDFSFKFSYAGIFKTLPLSTEKQRWMCDRVKLILLPLRATALFLQALLKRGQLSPMLICSVGVHSFGRLLRCGSLIVYGNRSLMLVQTKKFG